MGDLGGFWMPSGLLLLGFESMEVSFDCGKHVKAISVVSCGTGLPVMAKVSKYRWTSGYSFGTFICLYTSSY